MPSIQFILIQAIGLIGSILAIAALQFSSRKKILVLQFIAAILWMIHYAFLGAHTAVANNILCLARGIICYNNEKKWAKSKFWLYALIALYIFSAARTWAGMHSAFACIAMILTTVALWIHNMPATRMLFLINSPFMLAYNIMSGSYSTAVTESFALLTFIAAVWRFDIRKKASSDSTSD